MAGQQQLEHFVEQARRRHVFKQGCELGDRPFGCRIDGEPQLAGQTGSAQHAYRIFTVTLNRVTDHHHAFFLDVGNALGVIPYFFTLGIVEQRIHGEVAAQRILLLAAEHIVAQQAAVFIGVRGLGVFHLRIAATVTACIARATTAGHLVGRLFGHCRSFRSPIINILGDIRQRLGIRGRTAKRGDLDGLGAKHHVDDAEAAANDARAAEHTAHLLRCCAGSHVEVLGVTAQQ